MKLEEGVPALNYVRDSIPEASTRETEAFWLVLLNGENEPIGEPIKIAEGDRTSVFFEGRLALRLILDSDAKGIILVHNHPSGLAISSVQDELMTRGVVMVGDFAKFDVIDHVIVGRGGTVFSMRTAESLFLPNESSAERQAA